MDKPKETRKVDARLNFCFPDTVRIYRYSIQVAGQSRALYSSTVRTMYSPCYYSTRSIYEILSLERFRHFQTTFLSLSGRDPYYHLLLKLNNIVIYYYYVSDISYKIYFNTNRCYDILTFESIFLEKLVTNERMENNLFKLFPKLFPM